MFGLVTVNDNVELPLTRIEVGENALLITGGAATFRVSSAYLVVVPVSVEERYPVTLS